MLSTCHVPAAAARTRKAVETATAHRDHQLGCSWFSRRAMKVRSVQVPHSQHALHQSFHEHFVTPDTDEMARLLSEAGFRAPAVARKVAGGEPALVVTATK